MYQCRHCKQCTRPPNTHTYTHTVVSPAATINTDFQAAPFVSYCVSNELPSFSPLPPSTSTVSSLLPPPPLLLSLITWASNHSPMCTCTPAGFPQLPNHSHLSGFAPFPPPPPPLSPTNTPLLINLLCTIATFLSPRQWLLFQPLLIYHQVASYSSYLSLSPLSSPLLPHVSGLQSLAASFAYSLGSSAPLSRSFSPQSLPLHFFHTRPTAARLPVPSGGLQPLLRSAALA